MAASTGLTARELSPPSGSAWMRLWRPFWAVPLACVVVSAALGLLLPEVEARVDEHLPYVFSGGPSGARSVLSTIASAMISVTGLVFSITMVVLQLASSQFTPRVLGGFLASRIVQLTLGVFTATFVYSLALLRSVRDGENAFVPQTSVTTAFALVIASVVLFLVFINHITNNIQATFVISRLGDTTAPVIDRYFPEVSIRAHEEPIEQRPEVIVDVFRKHGYVTDIDYTALMRLAGNANAVIELLVGHGQTRSDGQGLAVIRGSGAAEVDPDEVRHTVRFSTARDGRVDPAFGIRQLVDIGARALSPGVNDPTTAVEVLNELHRLLRPLVARHDPGRQLHDDEGHVRVIWCPQTVGELVRLAFIEPITYGAGAPQVHLRIAQILDDLYAVSLEEHRPTIDEMRALLRRTTRASHA